MKAIFLLTIFIATLMATKLHWYDNYQEALQKAQKEHKLVYIFISSSTCGWCEKFEQTTLEDTKIKKRLARDFITLHLVREFDDVPKRFATTPVPRHYFLDSKGVILYNSLGYRKVATFEAFIDNAEEKNSKNQQEKK